MEFEENERALLFQLKEACKEFGITIQQALEEKRREILVRSFLRCIPNGSLKVTSVRGFLAEVLGRDPDPELIDRVQVHDRGPRLDEDEYLFIEQRQQLRCRLCGTILDREAGPHVDHIIPVSLGGRSEITNYQILCQECNLGKKDLTGWIMGAPFLLAFDDRVSAKLRYCVLTRFEATCSWPSCDEDSSSSRLDVVAIVPPQNGGRLIFDNLRTLCSHHSDVTKKQWRDDMEARLRRARRWNWVV